MVSKSIFNVDSKNVSEKFLHRHSWKNVFFFKTYFGGPKEKIWKKGFFQEWRWRNFSLTLKKDLETINLSSIWFGVGCNIGWVTSEPPATVTVNKDSPIENESKKPEESQVSNEDGKLNSGRLYRKV